ncbi:hypothetical protein BDN72DRAFT_855903 [Pluteus cervinus]|uniref:Uncharacterized protein n=1 Tax=Pluteus cervinus TaxID=181527 RepID=A0ACD3B1J1_9AGAR|nr:hypothetical protein BDN72DRAFT_855903 [Pluteus cervinus]
MPSLPSSPPNLQVPHRLDSAGDSDVYSELSDYFENEAFKELHVSSGRNRAQPDSGALDAVQATKRLLNLFRLHAGEPASDVDPRTYYDRLLSTILRQTYMIHECTINKPLLRLPCEPALFNPARRQEALFTGESDGCIYQVKLVDSDDEAPLRSKVKVYLPPVPSTSTSNGQPGRTEVKGSFPYAIAAIIVNVELDRLIVIQGELSATRIHVLTLMNCQRITTIQTEESTITHFIKHAELRGNRIAVSFVGHNETNMHITFFDIDRPSEIQTVTGCEPRSVYPFQFISPDSVLISRVQNEVILRDLRNGMDARVQVPWPTFGDIQPSFMDFVPNSAPCSIHHVGDKVPFIPNPQENLVGFRLVWTTTPTPMASAITKREKFLFASLGEMLRGGIYHHYDVTRTTAAWPKIYGRRIYWIEQGESGVPTLNLQTCIQGTALMSRRIFLGSSAAPTQNVAVAPVWEQAELVEDQKTLSTRTTLLPRADSDLSRFRILTIQVTSQWICLLVMRHRVAGDAWGIQYLAL